MPLVNHRENLGAAAVCVGVGTGWATDTSTRQAISNPAISIMFTADFNLPTPIFLRATVIAGSRINNAKTMVSLESSGISGLGVVVGVGVGVESVVDGAAVRVGFVIVGSAGGVDCGVAVGVVVGVFVGVGVGVNVAGL